MVDTNFHPMVDEDKSPTPEQWAELVKGVGAEVREGDGEVAWLNDFDYHRRCEICVEDLSEELADMQQAAQAKRDK